MAAKGIVYVPADSPRGWLGESPGTQRVAGRPLAGLILELLAAAGLADLAVLATPDQLEEIHRGLDDDGRGEHDAALIAVAPHSGLAGALRAGADFAGAAPAILHLATGLLGRSAAPLVAGLGDSPADLTLLLHHGRDRSARLSFEASRLLGISELDGDASRLSLAAVAALGPGGLARLAAAAAATGDHPTSAGPAQQRLVSLAEHLIHQGGTVCAGQVAEWCDYSAEPAALLELNRSVLDRLDAPPAHGEGSAGNRIEGRVRIDPSAEVNASVIIGPATIGPRARIRDAYIGPYTTVGAAALVEDSEIVRSVIGDGASITHVAGRIEGSTIGRDAHIHRDFALPRAMRLHVGDGVEVSLA